ncbi:MAG: hypothetical protein OEX08_01755 [Candidatus Nomurabacteria bacterium]|nr:hypothetical protein [Candidatus Nomurabacteria bacterium]
MISAEEVNLRSIKFFGILMPLFFIIVYIEGEQFVGNDFVSPILTLTGFVVVLSIVIAILSHRKSKARLKELRNIERSYQEK